MIKEIEGNLFDYLSEFDVVAHGCNCFCKMRRGIAVEFASRFNTHLFPMEDRLSIGDINKLGCIDYKYIDRDDESQIAVVNCYTQYSTKGMDPQKERHADYDAIRLAMRKINHVFKNKRIGLPAIGSGLAGGNWNTIRNIIAEELTDCEVTVVHFKN